MIKKNPEPEEIGSLKAFFVTGGLRAFNETVSPESVLVEDGNDGVFQMAIVVEVDAAVQRCGIPLPNGPVLPPVEELDEQRSRFQVIPLLVVGQVFLLILDPVFNIGLRITGKPEAVGKHPEGDKQMRPVTHLPVPEELHSADNRFLNHLAKDTGVRLTARMDHFKGPVTLEIPSVTVVVLDR